MSFALFGRANEEVNSFVPGPLAQEKRLGGIANKITDTTVELAQAEAQSVQINHRIHSGVNFIRCSSLFSNLLSA